MKLLRDVVLRTVPVVEPEASLEEVIEMMEAEPLQIVVIVGDSQYMGIFTPADQSSGQIPAGQNLDDLAVGPYSSGLRFVGSPQMSVDEARTLMVRHGIAVLPVVANRIYKGVVTADDLA